ncbi:MAG: hypothetical protein F4052_08100 [Dehalococcoidia bacterium]|nr:hypothetical protein [Dehalococcoidia bacterium]
MPLVDEIERVRGLATPPNEEATKFQLVLPILRELGWDAFDQSRVTPEYPVGTKKSGKVDLALMAPRRGPVALIEVKTADARLDDHVDQVLGYAFNEGVDICVLTTGWEWWLYLPREKGRPQERRFAELSLKRDSSDQLVDDFSTYLGYTALLEHKSERHARQVLAARLDSERLESELPRVWGSMLSSPPHELIELLEGRVFNSVRLRPSREQVADFLRAQTGSVVEAGLAAMPSTPRQSGGQPQPSTKGPKKKKAAVPPTTLRLWGRHYPVERWVDVFVFVAEALYELHADRFPDAVGSPAGRRSYVETTQYSLRAPRRVADSGYWLECHASASDLKRRAARLLALFGYDQTDMELIFE